jgi:hypothetical protein
MKKLLFIATLLVIGLSMMAQNRVYTPALNSPSDSATGQMPDVILSWYAVTGSVNLQYQFQLDTTMDFNSPLLVDETMSLLTAYQADQLLFNTMYYWRVRAIDGATSDWSEVWCFTVFDMLEPLKPNSANQDADVDLTWKETVGQIAVTGVDFFDYQVDTSLNFDSPLLLDGTVAGDVFTGTTEMLMFGADYHWRVRARHGADMSDWCEPVDFSILDEVSLSKPNNEAVDQELDVEIRWTAVGGIVAYEYQVALDTNFTDIVFHGEIEDYLINCEYLMFGMDYYWRVRARHLGDTTMWSEVRVFTTIDQVVLKLPGDAQTDVSLTPTLYWYGQDAASGYQLQVASDAAFNDIFWDVSPAAAEDEIRLTKKLTAQTMYYWRMRAFSNGSVMADTSGWTDPVWSFTTGWPQGIGDQQSASIRIYPNPASDAAYVQVKSQVQGTATLTMMDLVGKTVLNETLTIAPGEEVIPVSLDNIRKGLYIVRLTIGEETINQKLVVE